MSGPLARLTGHMSAVRTTAFSPDGGYLVSGDREGTLILWDLHEPRELRRFIAPRRTYFYSVHDAAVSPDGRWVGAGISFAAHVWNLESGELHWRGPIEDLAVQHVCFSADSRSLFYISGSRSWYEWKQRLPTAVCTGDWPATAVRVELRGTGEHRWKAGRCDPYLLAPICDGQVVTVTAGYGHQAAVLWTADGTELRRLEMERAECDDWRDDLSDAAFADGTLYLRTRRRLHQWQPRTGEQQVLQLPGERHLTRGFAVAPGAGRFLTGCGRLAALKRLGPGEPAGLLVRSLRSGRLLQRFDGHTAAPHGISVSPDDTLAASGDETGEVLLWQLHVR